MNFGPASRRLSAMACVVVGDAVPPLAACRPQAFEQPLAARLPRPRSTSAGRAKPAGPASVSVR